jgi:hypothetical protein
MLLLKICQYFIQFIVDRNRNLEELKTVGIDISERLLVFVLDGFFQVVNTLVRRNLDGKDV